MGAQAQAYRIERERMRKVVIQVLCTGIGIHGSFLAPFFTGTIIHMYIRTNMYALTLTVVTN